MVSPFANRRVVAAITVAVAVTGASCSSDDDAGSASAGSTEATTSTTAATATTAVEPAGRIPEEIVAPDAEGNGILLPQPAPPLPEGYVEEELFVGGTATTYSSVEEPSDGFWVATPAEDDVEYRTRVIVRRPPPDDFSGTVLVEWFNVTAVEASPDWAYLSEEIGREGHAYIGVSAQSQGVEGGETLLDVEADPDIAAEEGAVIDAGGLKNLDPARYSTLSHPGDAYAYEIFSQVGRAATESAGELLGGLEPTQVIGVGESQSAFFLTTLVNAVHPVDPAFDAFLIHSRGGSAAPLGGSLDAEATEDSRNVPTDPVRVRTDLDVPVLIFETESDLTLLEYAPARQPDTDFVRTWEVAGTAHADAHLLRAVIGGPRDPSLGSLLGCTEPINTAPQHEILQAALHQLVDWTSGSGLPPDAERLELVEGDDVAIARDEHGIAIGGVRNPFVDVPVATLTGEPPESAAIEDLADSENAVCLLFGGTYPFDEATLVELYGTADEYVRAFQAAADDAVEAGFLLPDDAAQLVDEAEANRGLFG